MDQTQSPWFTTDGGELQRNWVSYFVEIRKRALVKRSRNECTCLYGCNIPAGSSYLRLDLITSGGSCDVSYLAVAFCSDHLVKMAGEAPEQWLEGLQGESFFGALLKGVGTPAPVAVPTETSFVFKAGCSTKAASAKATTTEKELDIDLRHNELQKALYDRLASKYGEDNVGTERPSGVGTKVDVVVRQGSEYWFYEIKTALTPRACIREALGQLLEYAFWPGAQEPIRLIVVGECALDEDGAEYLSRLKKRFSLPIEYEQIVLN